MRAIKVCENDCCFSTECSLLIDMESEKFKSSNKHADFLCFKDNKIILIELKDIKSFNDPKKIENTINEKINQSPVSKNHIEDIYKKIKDIYCNGQMTYHFYIVVPKEVKSALIHVLRWSKKFDSVEIFSCTDK